ncbi:MAG TPA: glycoside hydrolase family 43 protein [Conexibacter sp.]|nr:glycoside hydrolase family 43 protein [Conexibacter sp.]
MFRRCLLVVLLLFVVGCGGDKGETATTTPTYANPVIAGQQPDPTVVRDGEDFLLATTSRAWAPIFPLFRSRDLVNWERIGALLPRAPTWSAAPYWAPELTRFDGQPRAYYTARLRRDRSRACIGVATARRAAGPYRDLGRPLTCPPSGAIDAFVARDEDGDPYLIYRRYRDGGGIWARALRADGLAVQGREHLLLPVTPADEGVVEGPELLRRDGRFVLLFAAGGCCRPPCDYREAAARADRLLGPYERAPRLVLRDGPTLRCNGHGTTVGDGRGRRWLLHHGVLADDPVNVRRSTLLEPLHWDGDGWPVAGDDGLPVERGAAPLGVAQRPPAPTTPDLTTPALDPAWEWPWDRPARAVQRAGRIELRGEPGGAVLARQVLPATDQRAQVVVERHDCAAGIAGVEGGQDAGIVHGIELLPGGRSVRVWQGPTGGGPGRTLATAVVADLGDPPELTVLIDDSQTLRFAVNGRPLPVTATTSENQRAIRVGLTCRGPRASGATFGALAIVP